MERAPWVQYVMRISPRIWGQEMPVEYVPSGPDIMREGRPVTPMAPIYRCEVCGFVGAPFGVKHGDEVLSYCGWVDSQPVCVGKGSAAATE